MKRKKLFMLSITTFIILGLSTVSAFASSVSNQNAITTSSSNNESDVKWANGTPQWTLTELSNFAYPDQGRERELGPEKYTYLKYTYDAKYKFLYTEVIREADEAILQKIYPDGTIENFTVGNVSSEDSKKFNDKYDPILIAKAVEEKTEQMNNDYQEVKDKINQGIIISVSSEDNDKIVHNYSIRAVSPSQDIISYLSLKTGADLNYKNLVEKPLESISSQVGQIRNKLSQENTPVKLVVTLVPYTCADYPSGYFFHASPENSFEIVIFNNGTSFIDQFNAQFENYKKEYKYYLED